LVVAIDVIETVPGVSYAEKLPEIPLRTILWEEFGYFRRTSSLID
jgi:hypothetical protein